MNRQRYEAIAKEVVDACIQVHRALGPGLLESTYQKCLLYELSSRGLKVTSEVSIPVVYKGVELDCGYRIDILVEDVIVLELKSVEKLLPVHSAQIITYLKLANKRLGFLLNFNVSLMKNGLNRFVNNY
jgi:GxxExxY protein